MGAYGDSLTYTSPSSSHTTSAMAASFAAYASQFINKQPLQESTQSSHEPLFFSFSSATVPEDDDDPHLDPFRRSPSPAPTTPPPNYRYSSPQPPPPTRAFSPVSPPPIGLTESLLPRDRHVFSLPDPRYPVRRKYHDSTWTAVWLTAVSICVVSSVLILFLTHKPSKQEAKYAPYTTLLRTVPIITILVVLSAVVSYAHLLFLRLFLKPVIVGTAVFVPATLFLSALCAFVGSFTVDDDHEPTWGETTGLRLFSLGPLILPIITGCRLLSLPRALHTASSLLSAQSAARLFQCLAFLNLTLEPFTICPLLHLSCHHLPALLPALFSIFKRPARSASGVVTATHREYATRTRTRTLCVGGVKDLPSRLLLSLLSLQLLRRPLAQLALVLTVAPVLAPLTPMPASRQRSSTTTATRTRRCRLQTRGSVTESL